VSKGVVVGNVSRGGEWSCVIGKSNQENVPISNLQPQASNVKMTRVPSNTQITTHQARGTSQSLPHSPQVR